MGWASVPAGPHLGGHGGPPHCHTPACSGQEEGRSGRRRPTGDRTRTIQADILPARAADGNGASRPLERGAPVGRMAEFEGRRALDRQGPPEPPPAVPVAPADFTRTHGVPMPHPSPTPILLRGLIVAVAGARRRRGQADGGAGPVLRGARSGRSWPRTASSATGRRSRRRACGSTRGPRCSRAATRGRRSCRASPRRACWSRRSATPTTA